MEQATISGDPEMIRIAQAFRDGLLDGINRKVAITDCEAEGAALAIRLLVISLQASGAIDSDHLHANAEMWTETIKGRTEKNPYHNEGTALVFRRLLGLDLEQPAQPDNPQKFNVIQGGRKPYDDSE